MDALSLLQIDIILRSLNATSYIVGGYIRDYLLGMPSKDIDIVTDAGYDLMANAFSLAGWHVKTIGKQYLVLNISKNGLHYELSNFRSDTDNTGGSAGSLSTDAFRRDFTINSLYHPISDVITKETIVDPTKQGLADASNYLLRFIGDPSHRIAEDPLRTARFYRLLHTKGLTAHPGSLRAVRKNFNYALHTASPERWRAEIERMIGL